MSELREGDRIGNRYVLEQRLGKGGMGEVWLAGLEGAGEFRRRVVLKVLAPERRGDPRLAGMLADEARLVALLHHPGIVAALDYLETEDHGPVFVLEFVDGVSLRHALQLARRTNLLLPQELASFVGAQVAHALHAAHTAVGLDGKPLEIVHRDVSPDNVLLARSGAVYLGDFGVARATLSSDDPGSAEEPKGKRGYMAPEQARGEKVDAAADIFSLGRVIAEAADVGCGPELRAVLDRATAENPRDRFATAAEMAEALLQACPPPRQPRVRLAEWLQTHCTEALLQREGLRVSSPAPRSDPPPAGRPLATPPRSQGGSGSSLFASVPPPSRRWITYAAGVLLVLALSLVPWALLRAEPRLLPGAGALPAVEGTTPPVRGDLRVESRPTSAEVYVDGRLAGTAPLRLQLEPGRHDVRIGSPRTGRFRAAEVQVRPGVELRLNADLR